MNLCKHCGIDNKTYTPRVKIILTSTYSIRIRIRALSNISKTYDFILTLIRYLMNIPRNHGVFISYYVLTNNLHYILFDSRWNRSVFNKTFPIQQQQTFNKQVLHKCQQSYSFETGLQLDTMIQHSR